MDKEENKVLSHRFACGCEAKQVGCNAVHIIEYCPKHKAAPDMYEALEAVYKDAIPDKRISMATLEKTIKALAKGKDEH